jgi:hypothetical protein
VEVDPVEDQFDQIIAAQQAEWGGIAPGIEKVKAAEWTLDKEGLAMKAFAANNAGGTQYGLIIARRDEEGSFVDPRNLTRAQMETVRDFVAFVLEDSEG